MHHMFLVHVLNIIIDHRSTSMINHLLAYHHSYNFLQFERYWATFLESKPKNIYEHYDDDDDDRDDNAYCIAFLFQLWQHTTSSTNKKQKPIILIRYNTLYLSPQCK
jgi:hypothetical protein